MNRVNCLPGELVMGDSWDWGPQRRLFEFQGWSKDCVTIASLK